MGASATVVMPTIKVVSCFIFMHLNSASLCLLAIARLWDFAVLLKSRFRSLFSDGRLNSSGILSPSSKIFERVVDLNRVIGDDTIGSTFAILRWAKDRFHVA